MSDPNVAIITTCSEDVSDYYKSIARSVSKWLAVSDYNLIFGASSKSMMGICYDEFKLHERIIYAITTKKYISDLDNLPRAIPIVCDTTFDMKKEIFQNSDLIVMLPGGIGTLSEFLAFIEEKRSNDKYVSIEIYDEDNFYKPFLDSLKSMVDLKFINPDIFNEFKISHNKDEFFEHILEYRKEEAEYIR